jgi:lipoprotein-releasing system permease protein
VRDWTRQNRTWFAAVQLEKRMMFIILTLIVAVAAFNLVSTLVMTVTDKRADIAILRTLGASPRSIMGIFVVQGAAVGVIGTLAGLLLGLAIAFNIDVIVPALEHLLNASFLPRDIYLISRMPSDPQSTTSCRSRHLAGAGLRRHALSELARQPRQSGRGAAL